MRILFVRHGESEANVLKVFSNRGWKHPLTPRGREQVQSLAKKLTGSKVNAIYTSPLQRAVESAEILGKTLNVQHEIKPALIEWDVGIYEGTTDEAGWKAHAEVSKQWANGQLDARITGGESCKDIHARFVPFIRQLTEKFADQPDAVLLLVGHGGTYCQALPAVLNNISCEYAAQHGFANAGYAEAEMRGGELRCVTWGDEVIR